MELHRAWHEPREPGEPGTYVIQERSRCDGIASSAPFPLQYAENEGDYWVNCSRGRDVDFNRPDPTPGFDFAQWTCPVSEGGHMIMISP